MQPDRLGTSEWTPPSDFSERYPYADGKFWIGRSPTDDTALGYDDDRHICLVSGNRGGKGTATIIPNLCLWPGSAIIIDPKGENATITAARRGPGSADCEGMGQRVYVLDPFEKAQVDSSLRGRFNPFDALDPDNPRTIDDAAKLADSIVVTNPESKDPFWDESARAMVRALILHVLTSPDFEGRRNLLTLREIVLHGDRLRAEKLRELGETNIPSSQSLLWHGVSKNESFNGVVSGIGTRFRDMALSSAKQFDSVLQVVDRNTEFLDSPGMRSVLEASDFSLRDLKTDPKGVSVYLSLPQSFMNTHFRWLRMMLALFVAEMEHVPGNKGANGHRILICMDEFAGLRRMEFIETAVSQIAGFGVKLFFVLQSLEQLKATYEKSWETFLANAGLKIFYSVGDQFTRKYISEYIGDTEITREMKSEAEMNGWNTGESWGSSTSESEQHSTTTSKNWGTSTNESHSASGGSSDSWESMPLFLRNTGGFFAGLAGERGASQNSGWQDGSGTGTQSGGSESENVGGSRTTTTNDGGSRGESGSSTITHSENLHKRPLITPDEIGRFFGRIDDAEFPFYPGCSLVLLEGKQPAVVRKSNYYEDGVFDRCFSPHPDHPLISSENRQKEIEFAQMGSHVVDLEFLGSGSGMEVYLGDPANSQLRQLPDGTPVESGDRVATIRFECLLDPYRVCEERMFVELNLTAPCEGVYYSCVPTHASNIAQDVDGFARMTIGCADVIGRLHSHKNATDVRHIRSGRIWSGATPYSEVETLIKTLSLERRRKVPWTHEIKMPPQWAMPLLVGDKSASCPIYLTPIVQPGQTVACGEKIAYLDHKKEGRRYVYSHCDGVVVAINNHGRMQGLNDMTEGGMFPHPDGSCRLELITIQEQQPTGRPFSKYGDWQKESYKDFPINKKWRFGLRTRQINLQGGDHADERHDAHGTFSEKD